MQSRSFPIGYPMVVLCISYVIPIVPLWIPMDFLWYPYGVCTASCGFSVFPQWVAYGFPMVPYGLPWVPHDLPIGILLIPYGILLGWYNIPCARRS